MGADNSKNQEDQLALERARATDARAKLEELQRQNAALLEAQRLEQYHREQRAQEEEKLKQARLKWQQENALRQQQLQSQPWQVGSPQLRQTPQLPLQSAPQPQLQVSPFQASNFYTLPYQQAHHQLQQQQQIEHQIPTPSVPSGPTSISSLVTPGPSSAEKKPSDSQAKNRSTSMKNKLVNNAPVEWDNIDYVQKKHGINRDVAQNLIALFKEKYTIPFIARYRKEVTLGMDCDQLRNVKTTHEHGVLMEQKANALIKEICKQYEWASDFCTVVRQTQSLHELEWMESMLEFLSSSPARKARKLGLDNSARAIFRGVEIPLLPSFAKHGTVDLGSEEVENGTVCILAEMIYMDPNMYNQMKKWRKKHDVRINVTKIDSAVKENQKPNKMKNRNVASTYEAYNNFSSLVKNLQPHQMWEIICGEESKMLNVYVNIPIQFKTDFMEYCKKQYPHAYNAPLSHKALLTDVFDYAWKKWIKPSIFKQTKQEMKNRAEIALIADFVKDAKQLLLTPPIREAGVIGINPGNSNGCKLAVVSATGKVLETEDIHPHDVDNPKGKIEAERILAGMILLHGCSFIALSNGTGCQETEAFLKELLKKPAFEQLNVTYRIVNGAVASFYSKSKDASSEFPDFDSDTICAISTARTLQDPLAEFVKIDATQLCNVIRKHDIPVQKLVSKLNEVMLEAVSLVGVDINTVPASQLRQVAGLKGSKTANIIKWRTSSGPFRTRNDLKKVPGICDKTFEQCAGFVTIKPETIANFDEGLATDSLNYLDQSCIHPESYAIAEAFISAANCNIRQFGTKSFIFGVKLLANQGYSELAKKFSTTVETMKIIVEGLSMEKNCDVRGKPKLSVPCKGSKSFDDLEVGDVLMGVVKGKAPFGVFININVGTDGLLHTSKMKGVTLDIGQKVEVKVINLKKERRLRIGLELIKCV